MRPPAAPLLARAALALYPPSWRARYGDEVLALLDDSGGGPAAGARELARQSERMSRVASLATERLQASLGWSPA